MKRSDLIAAVASRLRELPPGDIEVSIKLILDAITQALARGERIEVRGFGSFYLVFRPPRLGRNPQSGAIIQVRGKYLPRFKPGTQLRMLVDAAANSKRIDDTLA